MNTVFKSVGVEVFCGLWALKWTWQHGSTNLSCVFVSRICMLNLNLIVPEISTIIPTDGQTDRRTWLDRLGYWSWSPVTYFSRNVIYPFTLRVIMGKTKSKQTYRSFCVECLIAVFCQNHCYPGNLSEGRNKFTS